MSEEEQEETAAEATAEGGEEGQEDDGGGKKKLIIMIAAALVVLLGAGAGLYFSGVLGGSDKAESAEHAEDGHGDEEGYGEDDKHAGDDHGEGKEDKYAKDEGDHGKGDKAKEEKGKDGKGKDGKGGGSSQFLEIPTMIVNLNTDDGTPRYLRLTVQLELEKPSEAPSVEAVMPRVIDQFQTYLRELRVKDLRGSAGIYRLQMELLWRVNRASYPVKVKDVLFQEILIQ